MPTTRYRHVRRLHRLQPGTIKRSFVLELENRTIAIREIPIAAIDVLHHELGIPKQDAYSLGTAPAFVSYVVGNVLLCPSVTASHDAMAWTRQDILRVLSNAPMSEFV